MTDPVPTEPVPPSDPVSTDGRHWNRQYLIAVALLVAFAGFVVVMVVLADRSSDQVWQRRIYLFSAVEAIVFTAVGWLFGREVNRTAVESARQDATAARQTAAVAREEARRSAEDAAAAEQRAAAERARGETVAAVVEHSRPTGDDRDAGPRPAGAGLPGTGGTGTVVDLRALMRDLYGRRSDQDS
ncbi:hypothetical protein [Virgisporangium ochraceum]|uniref:Uncharacterized protein n=1 Tax=Virgisporangium ochraceum TaxID=65505 RepID=A0A8J4EF01_9ACTN|nr:hypothetical protein [Virgisporangium ochraceum]GIJ73150.1 hypothetical protein Voc01_080670 [Virgisporangium ochraceum]